MKMNKEILLVITTMCMLIACSNKTQITSIKGSYIPVTTKSNVDPVVADFIEGYKCKMSKEMDVVVAQSAMDMYTGSPESPLTNLTTDAMMLIDVDTLETDTRVAFMNVHGIRDEIAKGEVTVGDVFNLFPFDNEVCIVLMNGENLIELFQNVAESGRAGVSGNVKMNVKDKKINDLLVDNKQIDPQKEYTVVTIDYLAEGNDGLTALKKADHVYFTRIKLRDYMLDFFKKQTQQGRFLNSPKDGRITIIE